MPYFFIFSIKKGSLDISFYKNALECIRIPLMLGIFTGSLSLATHEEMIKTNTSNNQTRTSVKFQKKTLIIDQARDYQPQELER